MPRHLARRRTRRHVRITAVAGLAALALLVGAVPASASQPAAVIHSQLQERGPAGGGGYLFWLQNSVADPNHSVLFAKKSGRPKFRVNAPNTQGWSGGIDGSTLVYQQTNMASTKSDLFLFNLATKMRTKLPPAVNTPAWEFWPSMSGDFITFGRWIPSTNVWKELLFQRGHDSATTLDSIQGKGKTSIGNGQINGNFLVWEKCDARGNCQVFERDLEAGTTTKIPNPQSKSQYAPSVTSDGAVFFGRSGIGCGTHVSVVEDPLDGPQKVLFSLPVGIDFERSSVVVGATPTAVLFDRVKSDPVQWDIYRFTA
ncbi:MAG TPA: hypothetical protein VNN79_23190 [Actinomycetota bacterium]|nr:hypothetical protein [Actinomycetota bacterium]